VIIAYLDVITSEERLKTIRVIVISGDLFDKRLTYDSEEAQLISRWMERLCRRCGRLGVSIVLLEGTPSHDNRQSRWMVTNNEMVKANADVRYYEDIAIAPLYEGGPLTLFIQDEVNHDATKTWVRVTELMNSLGIDHVDFAVMHGMFTFQEPVRSIASHSEERYESIVKHRIIIGHHHKPAFFGKIRVPGSVERLRYNEEHDKGHYQFTYSPTKGVTDEVFLINTGATVFKSIDVIGKKFFEIEAILMGMEDYPDGSHIRLEMSRKDETYTAMSKLKSLFPHFDLSPKPIEAEMATENSDHLVDTPVMTSIRPDNIASLMLARMANAPDEVRALAAKILSAA
jgi:DNA repair exonuclease SbcCD nuclease subunit